MLLLVARCLLLVSCMLLVVQWWLLVDGRRPCRPCRPCRWLLLLFFTCFDQLKASKPSDAGVREVLSHPVRPQRDLYFEHPVVTFAPNKWWFTRKWNCFPSLPVILLMEEILHHLGCMKPWKQRDQLPINCLVGFLPSTEPPEVNGVLGMFLGPPVIPSHQLFGSLGFLTKHTLI